MRTQGAHGAEEEGAQHRRSLGAGNDGQYVAKPLLALLVVWQVGAANPQDAHRVDHRVVGLEVVKPKLEAAAVHVEHGITHVLVEVLHHLACRQGHACGRRMGGRKTFCNQPAPT